MIPITQKRETLRSAVAESVLEACTDTFARMMENDVPKKDILPLAKAAGILAAKKTSELIPYCHPLLIEAADVEFRLERSDALKGRLVVTARVETLSKTGVEMEALTAASVAALTVYDMLKPIDSGLEITSTRLVSKKGGKSQFKEKIPPHLKAAVIVTSDGTHQGRRSDKSGKLIQARLEALKIPCAYTILPDDIDQITAALKAYLEEGFLLVVTTGGTGLGPRDVTVEATRRVIDREIPGVMEAARAHGQRRTPYAMLSRGIVGQKGNALVVNLPGSSRGVEESLDALFPHLLHAYPMMRGGGHEPSTVSVSKEGASS